MSGRPRGRPIPIADFLDECGHHVNRLLQLNENMRTVTQTRLHLEHIVKTTADSYPEGSEVEPF
jgi:hypothetical protein